MDRQLLVQYSHRLEGHFPIDPVDTDFYKTLPGVKEAYRNPNTGLPEMPIPSMEQILTVVGTTELSSDRIASIIKAWLERNRTRITISDPHGHQKIEFEGPNLAKTTALIKEMIDKLVEISETSQITIRAIGLE